MGWTMVWAIGGPRPWPRPLVSTVVGFDFVKSFRMVWSGYFPSWLMSSLFVYCPRLVVPLVTLVMGLGRLGLCRPEPGT